MNKIFPLIMTSVLIATSAFAEDAKEYSDIVSGMESQLHEDRGGWIGQTRIDVSNTTFRNRTLGRSGSRYDFGLSFRSIGKFQIYGIVPLLSGNVWNEPVQHVGNLELGSEFRLLQVDKSPQMDLWMELRGRFAKSASERTLASNMDNYRTGLSLRTGRSWFRSEMGVGYQFRVNETEIETDVGDMIDFHLDLGFKIFSSVLVGADVNWYQVESLKQQGETVTPRMNWLNVGPRVEVQLGPGLTLFTLVLFPVEKSHSVEEIEVAVRDIYSSNLGGATANFGVQAGF